MKIKILIIMTIIVAFFYLLPQPNKEVSEAHHHNSNSKSKISESSKDLSVDFIIRNVRLYDGYDIYEEMDIMIKDNKVYKVAKNLADQSQLPELHADGKTLIPGFIDSHTHAYGDALVDALNFGVTTELDMFSMPEFAADKMKRRDNADNNLEADLFSATILATAAGGHGTEYGFKIPVLDSPKQADQFVLDRIAQGADYIKAVYNSKLARRQFFPSISKDIIKELIESAHENGVMLVVHVDNLISAKEVISLGANGIVHSFMDEVVDDELVDMMKTNKAFIIPTLSVEASVARLSNSTHLLENSKNIDYISRQQKQQLKAVFPDFKIPASGFQKALDSVQILSQAGITILAGTDAPNPGTTHGISIHGELAFLAQAGLTNQQVIYSATAAAREYFPIGLRGTLKVGAMASMILIDGNVFDDINYSAHINRIWKNGVQFKRLIDQDNSDLDQVFSTGLISDFNSSIKQTLMGTGIMPTSDQYAGGKSVVELTHLQRDSQQDKYLHVNGEIKKGFMFQWSGMSYLPGVDQGHGVNLSHVKTLTFDAKAGQNTAGFSVLLFQQGSFQPSTQEIRLSDQWQTYRVELANFNNLDLAEISNISIVVTRKLGKFEFMLDNLKFE